MKKFEYRAPRFCVDLPARLTVENAAMAGRCREISRDGMIFEFGQPVSLNAQGTVSVSFQDRTIDLKARVAHIDGLRVGLEFIYQGATERSTVAQLVALLPTAPSRPGPVLLS